jgi:hypothetical protein
VRPARALPYELHVRARVDAEEGTVNIYSGIPAKSQRSIKSILRMERAARGPTLSRRRPSSPIVGI